MTAEEAFKKAQEAKKKIEEDKLNKVINEKRFQEIISKITTVSEKGEMGIEFKESNKTYAECLKHLGYKVDFYGEDVMRVNWCCKE